MEKEEGCIVTINLPYDVGDKIYKVISWSWKTDTPPLFDIKEQEIVTIETTIESKWKY